MNVCTGELVCLRRFCTGENLQIWMSDDRSNNLTSTLHEYCHSNTLKQKMTQTNTSNMKFHIYKPRYIGGVIDPVADPACSLSTPNPISTNQYTNPIQPIGRYDLLTMTARDFFQLTGGSRSCSFQSLRKPSVFGSQSTHALCWDGKCFKSCFQFSAKWWELLFLFFCWTISLIISRCNFCFGFLFWFIIVGVVYACQAVLESSLWGKLSMIHFCLGNFGGCALLTVFNFELHQILMTIIVQASPHFSSLTWETWAVNT